VPVTSEYCPLQLTHCPGVMVRPQPAVLSCLGNVSLPTRLHLQCRCSLPCSDS
jgi:hypothetical protein